MLTQPFPLGVSVSVACIYVGRWGKTGEKNMAANTTSNREVARRNTGLLPILERVDRTITTVISPIATSGLGILCLYYVAVSYGFVVIGVIGGRQSLARLITNTTMNPMLIIIGVPMIPVSLVMLEALDIEDKSLYVWRSSVSPKISKIPIFGPVIEYFWPKPHRVPVISHPTGFVSTIDYITRSITGGLMLPFMGYLIGQFAFKHTRRNNVQKVILVSHILPLSNYSIRYIYYYCVTYSCEFVMRRIHSHMYMWVNPNGLL